jgi:hypothetical protein
MVAFMTDLMGLSLPYNALTGSIPSQLAELHRHEEDFSLFNAVQGPIPSTLDIQAAEDAVSNSSTADPSTLGLPYKTFNS